MLHDSEESGEFGFGRFALVLFECHLWVSNHSPLCWITIKFFYGNVFSKCNRHFSPTLCRLCILARDRPFLLPFAE